MTKKENIACIFPETRPDDRLVFPLVQVFDQVVYMQAVENDPRHGDRMAPFIERCRRENRLRLTDPAPLGADQPRFLSLIRDMTEHKETYLGQLSMLTLAEMHQGRGVESSSAILSGLMPGRDGQEDDALLWQSRLVLKLGELHDREQAEILEAMQRISKEQEELLAALREDDDQPFALTAGLEEPAQEGTSMLEHRLRAFTRLYLAGSGHSQPGLALTGHPAAMEILKETYELCHGTTPHPLGRLPLLPLQPYPIPDDALPPPPRQRCPELHGALASLCAGERQDENRLRQLARGIAAWSSLPEFASGPSGGPPCFLELVFFPEVSFCGLIHAAWGGRAKATKIDQTFSGGCAVGLLTMSNS